jgi:LPXTG-motif cell wall-anchored protein
VLFQYGIFSYLNIEPPSEDSASGSGTESSSMPMVVGGVAAAAVLVGLGAWLVARRRSSSADVE